MTRTLRTLLLTVAALAAFALVPAGASAGSKQFSIFEDDAVLLGLTDKDPEKAMAEVKYLGGDVVRVFVVWSKVSPAKTSRTVPAGFDPADHRSPGYDWSLYDAFIQRAQRNGLKVMLTLSGEIPFWASREPDRCPHFIGGYSNLALSCMWKPDQRLFEQFSQAVATRYKGLVEYYSLWNEPNLEHYLYPQWSRAGRSTIDLGGKMLRELWTSGYRGLTRVDPSVKNKVLFGETAAISSPMDTLYAALCLNQSGRPYKKGRVRRLMGCDKPAKLPIGGLAVHPYNKDAVGTVFTRSFTKDSMSMAYTGRATRVLRRAERYGRIPRGRGVYITEFGFQTKPPDKKGLSFNAQAKAMNESDRLFFGDKRIRAVAQFELYDVPEGVDDDVYNTGLRTQACQLKPSWGAYRMPLVVTRLADDSVEVWGQVRPSNARTQVALFAGRKGGQLVRIGSPRTNASGYFKVRVRRGQAAKLRYRFTWPAPNGETFASRTASAGKKIAYREKP
ncbi:MAG TPA: hypothetical protein VFY44_07100 [Thermoleophilaceae bacterium]|nr:hypothetical protein [Thermoleophilaceae bacterium]